MFVDAQSRLRDLIKAQLAAVQKFLTIFFLALIAALLLALPWALRLASVMLWLAGASMLMVSIGSLYSPFSRPFPVLTLQFTVMLMMVGWAGFLLQRRGKQELWGGLATSGLFFLLATKLGIPSLAQWRYADLFLAVLPPATAALLLFYLAIRFRLLRERKTLHLGGPAFTWLPDNISKVTRRFAK